jgi:hypothetical protein
MRAAFALLLAILCSPAGAQAPACEIFSHDDPKAPPLVREWLARSRDLRVLVCRVPGADAAEASEQYSGEGPTSRHGTVCSYPSHGLSPVGSGSARRLQRYEQGEALAMRMMPAGPCPPEHASPAPRYVLTYDLSHEAFASFMQWWLAAADSPQLFDASGPVGGDAANRLRAAIAAGHMRQAQLQRIVRLPGSVLRHRYSAFLDNPEAGAGASEYVLYVSRHRLHATWQLTAVAETAP